MHKILTAIGVLLAAAHGAAAQFPLPPSGPPMAAPLASPSPSPWPPPSPSPSPSPSLPSVAPAPDPNPPPLVQPSPAPPPAAKQTLADLAGHNDTVSPGVLGCFMDLGAAPSFGRSWIGVDYLMSWFKNAPVPGPLVTTSNAADGGVVGRPSTQVLFGSEPLNAGLQSGVQLNLGLWLDHNETIGLDASGFFFAARHYTNFSSGTSSSNQILAVPYTDPVNGPSAFIVSGTNPNNGSQVIGSITASSSTSLWGAEINGMLNLMRTRCFQLSLLGGFRHIELQESLDMNYTTQLPTAGPLYNATLADQFGTRNQFSGAQIGLKAEWAFDIVYVSILGKLAAGINHETVNINGQFSDPNGSFFSTFGAGAGGLLAQRSNIGSYTSNPFTVVPELQLKVGVKIFHNVEVFAGYDFLYLSQVVRPGDQIDPVINATQAGPNAAGGGTAAQLFGPARPMPLFNESSFWAQGINFGVQFIF